MTCICVPRELVICNDRNVLFSEKYHTLIWLYLCAHAGLMVGTVVLPVSFC